MANQPTDPDNEAVDYRWVMQVTFVLTVIIGAPLVGVVALLVDVTTWTTMANFALRVGAVVWLCTLLGVYFYDRRRR